ncbi:MAG TPA: J domain-containing protein [Roseivirga sp.]
MPKDYYAILGVDKNVSDAEIKLAFRNKAKHLHPDVNQSEEANSQFQELNEAYSILSDPSSRLRYDNGELKAPEVTFTWEEVEQILRERERKRRGWGSYADTERIYPPTNYEANERTVQLINLAILLFAFTFILDFFIFTNTDSAIVLQKNIIAQVAEDGSREIIRVEVETPIVQFNLFKSDYIPEIGEEVQLKKSLFYGDYKHKTSGSINYQRAYHNPFVIYVMAALACIIAWFGTSKYFNAERKFNAAIISVFICIAMIVILFYPK